MKTITLLLFTWVISASATPTTYVQVLTGDNFQFGDGQQISGKTSASAFSETPSISTVYAQSKGGTTITWLNEYQARLQAWDYQWIGPLNGPGNAPTSPTAATTNSATFIIPATWGNYTVSGYVHQASNTSYTGQPVVQIGNNGCAINGSENYYYSTGTCAFTHAKGTTGRLDITFQNQITQFGSSQYSWFNVLVSDPPLPTAASATPEPSSLALMGLAAIGAGIAFRKKLKH